MNHIQRKPVWLHDNPPHDAMRVAWRKDLDEIAMLPPGWDGKTSEPLTAVAYKMIEEFLHSIQLLPRPGKPNLPKPQLFPLPYGGAQIEWHYNGNSIEIEVLADGSWHILAQESDDTYVVDVEGTTIAEADGHCWTAWNLLTRWVYPTLIDTKIEGENI